MCTTMRKLRRGTPHGIMMKMFKRKVTWQIKELKKQIGLAADITPILQKVTALKNLRRTIKI